jgi:hypothetical protein
VQKLSTDIRTRIEGLMRMVTVDLQEQANRRERLERDAIDKISETLSALTDNLMTLIAISATSCRKWKVRANPLRVLSWISWEVFDFRTSSDSSSSNSTGWLSVDDHIQAIDAMLEGRRDDLDEETLPQKLDNLFDNYEMAGQRETHMLRAAAPNRSRRGR